VSLQMSNTAATAAATRPATGRRRLVRALLQAAPGPPPAPQLASDATAEIEAIRAQLALVAGSEVNIGVSSHSVSCSALLVGARADSWNDALHMAFLAGVAADLNVSQADVVVSFVHDTYGFAGLDVPFSVNKFMDPSDDGIAAAQAAVAVLAAGLPGTLAAVRAANTSRA
jgi:hypothetical protein